VRLRLRVVATAEREIREAASWWMEYRPAAPKLFEEELARDYRIVEQTAEVLGLWHTSRGQGPPI